METPNTPRSIGRQPVFTEASAFEVLEFYRTLGVPMGLKAFCQQAYEQFLTPRVISTATMRKLLQGRLFPDLRRTDTNAHFDYASISVNRVKRGRDRVYGGKFDEIAIRHRLKDELKRELLAILRAEIADEISNYQLGRSPT